MTDVIQIEAEQRGIARLCHFTPSRNLVHIASGRTGILATQDLNSDPQRVFTPTDRLRLDGHPECVCCSVEYPNLWYLDRARQAEKVFDDWVITLISPTYLWKAGTLFSPGNAARSHGRSIQEGLTGFRAMFAEAVIGSGGRTFRRISNRLPSCPTDEQAEVLIPGGISQEDILGVVVSSETQAKNEFTRLRLAGVMHHGLAFIVAPVLFDKHALSYHIQSGLRPVERVWNGRNGHADGE